MVAVVWNPHVVCRDLQKSCQILTERCLKLSAKWAAEQWMGLPPEVISAAATPVLNDSSIIDEFGTSVAATTTIPEELEWNHNVQNKYNPGLYYARTLLELGEYAHAAAILSQTSLTKAASVEQGVPPPIPNLSPAAIHLRAYALYLAGERRKEEGKIVVDNTTVSGTTANAGVEVSASNPR